MLVIILQTTIIGGVVYEPDSRPQSVNDAAAEHMVAIGNARRYETKVAEPTEKKSLPGQSSALQPAPASRKQTATRRRPTKS